jgi:hypothetical protein
VRIADLTAQPERIEVFYVGFDGTTGGHVYAGVGPGTAGRSIASGR